MTKLVKLDLGLEFFETSAKENINVKAVFEKLVEIICDKMAESLDKVGSFCKYIERGVFFVNFKRDNDNGFLGAVLVVL